MSALVYTFTVIRKNTFPRTVFCYTSTGALAGGICSSVWQTQHVFELNKESELRLFDLQCRFIERIGAHI